MNRLARLALVGVFAAAAAAPAGAETIALACGSGTGQQICREGVDAWSQRSGHQVTFVSVPNSVTEQLALYQRVQGSSPCAPTKIKDLAKGC